MFHQGGVFEWVNNPFLPYPPFEKCIFIIFCVLVEHTVSGLEPFKTEFARCSMGLCDRTFIVIKCRYISLRVDSGGHERTNKVVLYTSCKIFVKYI